MTSIKGPENSGEGPLLTQHGIEWRVPSCRLPTDWFCGWLLGKYSSEVTNFLIHLFKTSYLLYQFNVFRQVLPTVQPGYLRDLIPEDAPEVGQSWESIFNDIERVIMPGVSELNQKSIDSHCFNYWFQVAHWGSPNFHAYYPMSSSFPGILAGVLSEGLGLNGLTWVFIIKKR